MSRAFEFEWDPKKAAYNLKEHGVSFEEAALLIQDSRYLLEASPKHGEIRYKATGSLETSVLTVVFTPRNDKIRIISARSASREEREAYRKIQNG